MFILDIFDWIVIQTKNWQWWGSVTASRGTRLEALENGLGRKQGAPARNPRHTSGTKHTCRNAPERHGASRLMNDMAIPLWRKREERAAEIPETG